MPYLVICWKLRHPGWNMHCSCQASDMVRILIWCCDVLRMIGSLEQNVTTSYQRWLRGTVTIELCHPQGSPLDSASTQTRPRGGFLHVDDTRTMGVQSFESWSSHDWFGIHFPDGSSSPCAIMVFLFWQWSRTDESVHWQTDGLYQTYCLTSTLSLKYWL